MADRSRSLRRARSTARVSRTAGADGQTAVRRLSGVRRGSCARPVEAAALPAHGKGGAGAGDRRPRSWSVDASVRASAALRGSTPRSPPRRWRASIGAVRRPHAGEQIARFSARPGTNGFWTKAITLDACREPVPARAGLGPCIRTWPPLGVRAARATNRDRVRRCAPPAQCLRVSAGTTRAPACRLSMSWAAPASKPPPWSPASRELGPSERQTRAHCRLGAAIPSVAAMLADPSRLLGVSLAVEPATVAAPSAFCSAILCVRPECASCVTAGQTTPARPFFGAPRNREVPARPGFELARERACPDRRVDRHGPPCSQPHGRNSRERRRRGGRPGRSREWSASPMAGQPDCA